MVKQENPELYQEVDSIKISGFKNYKLGDPIKNHIYQSNDDLYHPISGTIYPIEPYNNFYKYISSLFGEFVGCKNWLYDTYKRVDDINFYDKSIEMYTLKDSLFSSKIDVFLLYIDSKLCAIYIELPYHKMDENTLILLKSKFGMNYTTDEKLKSKKWETEDAKLIFNESKILSFSTHPIQGGFNNLSNGSIMIFNKNFETKLLNNFKINVEKEIDKIKTENF